MYQLNRERPPISSVQQQPAKQTYTVKEIALILGIGERTAYQFCEKTKDFKVLRFGRSVRVHKESFDAWFGAV